MAEAAATRHAIGLWAGLAVLACALFAAVVLTRAPPPGDPVAMADIERILLWHSVLPRAVTAILCGAALGLSGALLQRVLRNPIADPSTLGIAAGAQLALTLAIAFAPALIAFSREAVAFAGGVAVIAIVVGLSWRRGLDPVTVVLSGMVISLVAAALGASVVLAQGDYLLSLYIWGAGPLDQQNWNAVLTIAPRLALGAVAAGLLLRPLAMVGLDDSAARSLGVALHTARVLIVGLAVWLAATVTAEVGIIGFVGLAAPAFARAGGARTPAQIVLVSPLAGAIVLWLTDSAVQLLGRGAYDLAPTGAATALLGGPLLLWLLTRVRFAGRPPASLPPAPRRRVAHPLLACGWLAVGTLVLAVIALTVGPGGDGWHVATGALFSDLLPFRGPRIAAAAAAGAMLGAAGTLMQRMTGNPLAGPEVLGVSAGSGVGLAAVLFLAPFSMAAMAGGIAGGALVAALAILAVSSRSGFSPERLLLAGLATSALCMAVLSTVMAQGDMRSYTLLTWISGSTNNAGPLQAWVGAVSALVLIAPLFVFVRPLDILPLGEAAGRGMGLGVTASRLTLAVFAALLTAIASFLIGPLSLIGLIAPHLARLTGFARGRDQLLASVLLGCAIMVLADWLSRIVLFPYQVPVGLFAALLGGPYLVWLLSRQEAHHD